MKAIYSNLRILATCFWTILLVASQSFAGRPVFTQVDRQYLLENSDFIFSGYPSPLKAKFACPHPAGQWQVHTVLRGDKALEGSIISIANNGYKFFFDTKGKPKPPPTFSAKKFQSGELNFDSSTSFLFTSRNSDGCFELVAQGAQISGALAPEIKALLAAKSDCETITRGFVFHTDSFSKSCEQDSDCNSFQLSPNKCDRPHILNVGTKDKLNDPGFLSLKKLYRAACSQSWPQQDKCEPAAIPVRCKDKICQKGIYSFTGFKFDKIILADGCAPHDALAATINFVKNDQKFPRFSVTWWSDKRPNKNGGVFTLESKGPDYYAQGFQASLCTNSYDCEQPKYIKLKISLKKGAATGRIEFTIRTTENQAVRGDEIFYYNTTDQALCG